MKKTSLLLALTTVQCAFLTPVQLHAAGYTGWSNKNNAWYHYTDGIMAQNTVIYADGNYYGFNSDGKMVTGLFDYNNTTYYFKKSGAAVRSDWVQINGKWYYFDQYGNMVKNQQLDLDNATYLFNSDGSAFTGWRTNTQGKWNFYRSNCMKAKNIWLQINGKWYFFDSTGNMKTGWLESGNKKYYLQSNGEMATGTLTIDKVICTFSSSGELINEENITTTPSIPDNSETTTSNSSSNYVDITKEEYIRKVKEFISKPEYADGAPWGLTQKPLLATGGGYGCGAYSIDFQIYVFGNKLKYVNEYTNDASHIRTGDLIFIKNHVICVLYRDGNLLYTAEGNYGGRVYAGQNYRIEGDQLCIGTLSGGNRKIYRLYHCLPEEFD